MVEAGAAIVPGAWRRPKGHVWAAIVLVALLATMPFTSSLFGTDYYLVFFCRVVIMAIAAVGLNLALGFGGMVSLGHSLYIGIGAYAVGVLMANGVVDGWVHLAAALGIGAVVAIVIGSISLRTSGIGFIMITLAFAQMGYYLLVSLGTYGGDEGLPLARRSAFGALDLASASTFYYFCFAILLCVVCVLTRVVRSRFGLSLQGSKSNARRMAAMGVSVRPVQIAAYVVSAEICVVAGFLLANLSRFTSPSYVTFGASGELLVMVVLGGAGSVFGPVVGAIALLSFEEALANFRPGWMPLLETQVNEHWMALLGLLIVTVTLRWRHGLYGRRDR